ncbi:MAG: methyltransferase, partial [Pseudomonadota bacterium]
MTAAPDEERLAEAYNRGLAAEEAGDLDTAEAAYQEVLRLDPSDHGGASVRLASIGRAPDPDRAPDAYVATLFGQHAASFDDVLVDQLGYRVPQMIAAKLGEIGLGPFGRVLDLGCGTGLMGIALGDRAGELIGVDLAEDMLAQTDERGCYHQLFIGEAVQFLLEEETGFDLIAAADVLPYIGDLTALTRALRPCLNPAAIVAVSSETLGKDAFDSRGWRVGPRHRFAHAESYLRQSLEGIGLTLL